MITKWLIVFAIFGTGIWLWHKFTKHEYEFVKLESYGRTDDHLIMYVDRHGEFSSKQQKFISGESKQDWYWYEPGEGVGLPVRNSLEKVLQGIYSANKGRTDFHEKYPAAGMN